MFAESLAGVIASEAKQSKAKLLWIATAADGWLAMTLPGCRRKLL
jgi:hypothetical protein